MRLRKWNRLKRKVRRKEGRNLHHFLLAKSLGGRDSFNNLLLMKVERHELFGLMTAEEVLALLERVVRAKKHQHSDHLAA